MHVILNDEIKECRHSTSSYQADISCRTVQFVNFPKGDKIYFKSCNLTLLPGKLVLVSLMVLETNTNSMFKSPFLGNSVCIPF